MPRTPVGPAPLALRVLPIFLLAVTLAAVPVAAAELATSEGLHSVNGTELWVKRLGSGDPIVIVHGGPVLEHSYFLPHLAPLAEEYELIFFDQRLSGRSASEVNESEVRMVAFVEDIEAVRVELGLGKIHLMGHSWGGQLAMRYAIEHEANLRSLILLDSMAASSKLWREEEKLVAEMLTEEIAAERQAILESEALEARQPEAIEKLLRVSFSIQFADPDKATELDFLVPPDYGERSRQFAALAPDIESFDLHEALSTLSVPALVLYGAMEPGAGLGGAAIAEALSGSELVVIPDAGHFPFIEQPEAFLKAVRSFLERPPGVGAHGAPSELFDSGWQLTSVGEEAVSAPGDREPHLVLHSEEKMVSGFGGCNRLSGSFELDEESIAFGPIMSTRMSCAGADEVEIALLSALEKAERWRFQDDLLELLDGSGALLARFEAVELD